MVCIEYLVTLTDFEMRVMFFQQARRQSFNSAEKSVALTETKPFNLRSEERGRAKQALLEQRLMAQRKQVKNT